MNLAFSRRAFTLCLILGLSRIGLAAGPTKLTELADTTLQRLTEDFSLQEKSGRDDEFFMSLREHTTGRNVGFARVFHGKLLRKLVYIHLQDGIDAHLIVGFAAAESPVPHFFLDMVDDGHFEALHTDLMPRFELMGELDYIQAVYSPLEKHAQVFAGDPRYIRGDLSPLQETFLSPWLLNVKAEQPLPGDFAAAIAGYYAEWHRAMQDGVPAKETGKHSPLVLASRDFTVRRLFFSPTVDPVWSYVESLLGAEQAAALRVQLHSND